MTETTEVLVATFEPQIIAPWQRLLYHELKAASQGDPQVTVTEGLHPGLHTWSFETPAWRVEFDGRRLVATGITSPITIRPGLSIGLRSKSIRLTGV